MGIGKRVIKRKLFLWKMKKAMLSILVTSFLAALAVVPSSQGETVKGADGLAQVAQPYLGDKPRFNFLGPDPNGDNLGDIEMMQLGPAVEGNTQWYDPFNANIGSRVAVKVYFHNGVPNTVARDTVIRVDLQPFEANPIEMMSWLWSRDTDPIRETVVNGNIVGRKDATIILPNGVVGKAQYVSGTTWLYTRDQNFPNDPNKIITTHLADGITEQGVNIGNIQGCWPFSGYVSFVLEIKGKAALKLIKKVSHSTPTPNFVDEIIANPGDEVVYQLQIDNVGNDLAKNILTKDELPPHIAYLPGTTFLTNASNPGGVKVVDDNWLTAGLNIPDMVPGPAGRTFVTFKAKVTHSVPPGPWNLVNTAWVYLKGVEQDMDQANVHVEVQVPVTALEIKKHILLPNGQFVKYTDINLLQTITYHIKITNAGNTTINNVNVKDVLPVFVNFIPGSVRLNNKTSAEVGFNLDQIVYGGINIGTLPKGAVAEIILSGQVYGCPPAGNYKLQNTAYTWADGVPELVDTATANVKMVAPPMPGLNS